MTSPADGGRRTRLSVAMIVRNEEAVLAESLESVRSVADEIVVLDTGSTDGTVAVAERFDAKVGHWAWESDFAAARNACRELATGDWILWLDAGERLDAESADELRALIDDRADPAKVYMLMVEIPPADHAVAAEQVAQPRLMPNRADLRFFGRVRETLRPAIESADLQIDTLDLRILRHPRQHDLGGKTLRAHRNLELIALEAGRSGCLSARLSLAQGDAYADLGDFENARNAFRSVIELTENGSTEMLEAYYGLLAGFDADPFLHDLQLNTCVEALEFFPFDVQLLMAAGNALQEKSRPDMAIRSYEIAYQYGQVDLETWHLVEIAELTAQCLSLALQTEDRNDEAQTVLEDSLECNHGSLRLRRSLIDLHIQQGRHVSAIDLADAIPLPAEQREPLRDAVRGACKAAQNDWTPALGYLQSAYVAGCRDPICLRWLSVTLLSNAQVDAVRPVLHEWQQVEPTNAELRIYLAAVEQQTSVEAAADSTERQFRVDPGTSTLEGVLPILPIVSQATSADSMTQPKS